MKELFFFLFFLLTVPLAQSQMNVDSLQNVLHKTKIDRSNLQRYLDMMQEMKPNETEEVQVIGDWIIKNTDTDSLRETLAAANFALGRKYVSILNFEEAARYLTVAQDIGEKYNFFTIQADVLNELGVIYGKNEQAGKAIAFHEKSLDISKKKIITCGASRSLNITWAGYNWTLRKEILRM